MSTIPWNIEQTRKLVHQLFGTPQLELARAPLNSIIERQKYAQFHYHELKALFEGFASLHLVEEASIIGLSDEAELEFQVLVVKVGAHAIGALQSIHSLADILTGAWYHCLGMNLDPDALTDRSINAASVSSSLRSRGLLMSATVELARITGSEDYKYLAAATNLSKHRSVVRPTVSEDWTGKEPERHAVKFADFKYGGQRYPSKSILDTLKPVFDDFAKLIVDAGHELNESLATRLLSSKSI